MEFQQEHLFEVVPEVGPLLELHHKELTQDAQTLDPNWLHYAALERLGALVVFTARQDGRLIGYSAFFINEHRHYKALTVASNDVIFIHPDYRTGRTGINLIRYCEKALTQRLTHFKLVWYAKPVNPLADILSRMGYVQEEVSMAKSF